MSTTTTEEIRRGSKTIYAIIDADSVSVLVQEILPDVRREAREVFVSGVTPLEWAQLFGGRLAKLIRQAHRAMGSTATWAGFSEPLSRLAPLFRTPTAVRSECLIDPAKGEGSASFGLRLDAGSPPDC